MYAKPVENQRAVEPNVNRQVISLACLLLLTTATSPDSALTAFHISSNSSNSGSNACKLSRNGNLAPTLHNWLVTAVRYNKPRHRVICGSHPVTSGIHGPANARSMSGISSSKLATSICSISFASASLPLLFPMPSAQSIKSGSGHGAGVAKLQQQTL